MSGAAVLLEIWERARALTPMARLRLLAGDAMDDQPLGAAVAAVLTRHRALFGPEMLGIISCPECGTTLEVACDTDTFLSAVPPPADGLHALTVDGETIRFRLPTLADLTDIPPEADEATAALDLLDRCLRDGGACPALLEPVSARMAELDPLGDAELSLLCHECGTAFVRGFDAGAFLWDKIQTHARHLLGQVHILARAYGWSERDILGLSSIRRQAYLDMIES